MIHNIIASLDHVDKEMNPVIRYVKAANKLERSIILNMTGCQKKKIL